MICQARRKRGGAGGASAPNNLLKFADFVSEKAVKAKVVRTKIQICFHSRKLPESIKNAISFDVIQVKKFKNFRGKTLISRDFASVNSTFSKNGSFSNDLKGVVMKNFPGGKPPNPRFCSLLVSAPPNMNFVPTGLFANIRIHNCDKSP